MPPKRTPLGSDNHLVNFVGHSPSVKAAVEQEQAHKKIKLN
jgi:hypothetical protein